MGDYQNYDFTIHSVSDLIKMITEVQESGQQVFLYINGFYYDIESEVTEN